MQELMSRGAQMAAHIDDVCLGTNTQEDHLVLLGEFFAVCQENHTRLKLEKCEFMQETMQYLGFDVGYGWWTPAASKAKPLMDAKVRHEDPKKGRSQQKKKKNQENDAAPEKIERKIVFSDLRNPPKQFYAAVWRGRKI